MEIQEQQSNDNEQIKSSYNENNKRLGLDEIEKMIQQGITPPGIELINDLPLDNVNLSAYDDKVEKRPLKPWEKKENDIINKDNEKSEDDQKDKNKNEENEEKNKDC